MPDISAEYDLPWPPEPPLQPIIKMFPDNECYGMAWCHSSGTARQLMALWEAQCKEYESNGAHQRKASFDELLGHRTGWGVPRYGSRANLLSDLMD